MQQGPPPPQPPRTPFNNMSNPMPMNFGNSEPAPFMPMATSQPRVNRPPTPPQVVRPPPPPIKTQPDRKMNAPSGLDEILAELSGADPQLSRADPRSSGTPQNKTPSSRNGLERQERQERQERLEEVNNQINDGKSISSMSSGRRKAKRQITLDL